MVSESHKYTESPQTDLKTYTCPKQACIHQALTHEAQILFDPYHYDQPFLRYKAVENQKCTEWPQNDMKHLTLKSTLYKCLHGDIVDRYLSLIKFNVFLRVTCFL